MAKILEGFCSNLLELNEKIDAVQNRLEEEVTEPNDRDLLDNSLFFIGESSAGDSDPLGMPIAVIPSITMVREKKKKNRMKKKTREIIFGLCCHREAIMIILNFLSRKR